MPDATISPAHGNKTAHGEKAVPGGKAARSIARRHEAALLIPLPALLALVYSFTPVRDALDGGVAAELIALVLATVSDAYIQVTGFVAATLFIFYGLEKIAGIDAEKLLGDARPNHQVILAAALGALPGCGGAIVVVTQYATGRLSFGAVLAVLTATMGDAAFLLIAAEPLTGIALVALGFVVGTATGMVANALHGAEFLRPPRISPVVIPGTGQDFFGRGLDRLWLVLFLPGLALGILAALQIDIDASLGTAFWQQPSIGIGAAGGILCCTMFLAPKIVPRLGAANPAAAHPLAALSRKVISDSNFVTAWVVLAFLAFEISIYALDVNLANLFRGYVVFTPMIAILIGFIPGCGPQVLVTTLYLAGAIPLSAQIGNAISNDGDALFPAIAIAPRAAIIATIYSAIPALLFGYGWMVLVEF